MRIGIKSVKVGRQDQLTIVFNHDVHNSPEGRRGLRILLSNVDRQSFVTDRISITFPHSGGNPLVNTQAACQRLMDQQCDTPIRLTFSDTLVHTDIRRERIENRDQLDAARRKGRTITAEVQVTSTMAIISQDVDVIDSIRPGRLIAHRTGDPFSLMMRVRLTGGLVLADPWSLMDSYKHAIAEAIN